MNKNKTVVRSMDILNLFIDHAQLTFQEIVDLSGIPKTSVYRMLKSLEEMGLLEKGEDNFYRLGLLFLKFGTLVSERLDLRQIAYPIMEELHADVREAVNLIILQNGEAVYIEKIDYKQEVRLYTGVGRKAPLYAGACSRILLSFMDDEVIEEYIQDTPLQQYAEGTITEEQKLYKSIEEARDQGYTISYSELQSHSAAIAAPIFDHTGKVVAGLSIAGVEMNYQGENVARFAEKVMEKAAEISRRLGYIPTTS